MKNPYSTYRGRTNWLRRILLAIVILLVIALIAAVAGLFVLPNYVEYTPDGPRLVIPFFGGGEGKETPAPTPDGTVDPTDIVIETLPPLPVAHSRSASRPRLSAPPAGHASGAGGL